MVVITLTLLSVSLVVAHGHNAFGFNSGNISGFHDSANVRAISLTGGGAYDLPDFVHSAGGFRCLTDIAGSLSTSPFTGCKAGEGVRWDTVQLLPSTPFKCTGATTEVLKTAVTRDDTVVLLADFYRAGDGVDESFTAKMFVSAIDWAPDDIPGIQNVWVQGVGCGEAIVHFNKD